MTTHCSLNDGSGYGYVRTLSRKLHTWEVTLSYVFGCRESRFSLYYEFLALQQSRFPWRDSGFWGPPSIAVFLKVLTYCSIWLPGRGFSTYSSPGQSSLMSSKVAFGYHDGWHLEELLVAPSSLQ